METLLSIVVLLSSACFAFAQNPLISNLKKDEQAVTGLKYSAMDAIYLREGFSNNADLKKLLVSTASGGVAGVFNILFTTSYRLGYRGVTSILHSEIAAAGKKFTVDVTAGGDIRCEQKNA